ncbi:zinc ribbon domain-containing protein [Candidatus Pacearchaeota archaeon]|nr:zinc ribbon domain-containing protein [Candidatus Pacearchaeota archaeon]
MFKRNECKNCGEKLDRKYSFCPTCGEYLKEKKKSKNDGLLGDDDFLNEFEDYNSPILGGISGRMINKMFESAMKILEKEMRKEIKKNPVNKGPKTEYRLYINGRKIEPRELSNNKNQIEEKEIKDLPNNILKNFSALPRKEPKTNVRRFSDKIVYEVVVPGVKSIEDISIIQLENSLEIKAVTKGKAYYKIIPINLPVIDYELSEGKLVLELDSKE